MADVFLASHGNDKSAADRLTRALAGLGIRIERRDHKTLASRGAKSAIENSEAILVVWSHKAAGEPLMKQFSAAMAQSNLHIACFDDAPPPQHPGQRYDLSRWRGDRHDSAFVGLSRSLPARRGGKPAKNDAPLVSVIVQNQATELAGAAPDLRRPLSTWAPENSGGDLLEIITPTGAAVDEPIRGGGAARLAAIAAAGVAAVGIAGGAAFYFLRPSSEPVETAAEPVAEAPPARMAAVAPETVPVPAADETSPAEAASAAAPETAASTPTTPAPPAADARLRGRLDAVDRPAATPPKPRLVQPAAATATAAASPPPAPAAAQAQAQAGPRLAPARLRDRIVGAPAGSLFLLPPDTRAMVERARGSASRGTEAAERALASDNVPNMRTAQIGGGATYAGEWSGGAANGAGTSRSRDGSEYAGTWQNSRWHGRGVLIYPNGVRYDGEFANGAPTGRGVYWDPQGRQVTGADATAPRDAK